MRNKILLEPFDEVIVAYGAKNEIVGMWKRQDTTVGYNNKVLTRRREMKIKKKVMFIVGTKRQFDWK